jgi:hypothetical protein
MTLLSVARTLLVRERAAETKRRAIARSIFSCSRTLSSRCQMSAFASLSSRLTKDPASAARITLEATCPMERWRERTVVESIGVFASVMQQRPRSSGPVETG